MKYGELDELTFTIGLYAIGGRCSHLPLGAV